MPVPPNTSSGTALTISPLPFSYSQRVDDSGTTYTVWYKYTHSGVSAVIGVLGYGDQSIYMPTLDVLDSGLSSYLSIQGINVPVQVPVENGATYYFRITPNSGNPTPANLTLTAYEAPDYTAPVGSIVIPDDFSSLPRVTILPSTADDQVLQFRVFSQGEAGDVLPSGIMAVEDLVGTDDIVMYDEDFNQFATVNINTSTARGSIRANPTLNRFYAISKTPNPDQVVAIEPSGTISATYTITATNDVEVLAVGNDGDTLYYWRTVDTQKIRRWTLSSGSALTDLADYGAGGSVVDIHVLTDGTILAMFANFLTNQKVRHIATDGTLLHTFDVSAADMNFPGGTFPRLARANDDPLSFWVLTHHDVSNPAGTGGTAKFQNIRISDGAVLNVRRFVEYEVGSYQGDTTAVPFVPFGPSFSCPFWILPLAVAGTDGTFGTETGGVIGPLVWVHCLREVLS